MLSFEEIEDCFPDGACSDDATGKTMVSAQWLHDFARAVSIATEKNFLHDMERSLMFTKDTPAWMKDECRQRLATLRSNV